MDSPVELPIELFKVITSSLGPDTEKLLAVLFSHTSHCMRAQYKDKVTHDAMYQLCVHSAGLESSGLLEWCIANKFPMDESVPTVAAKKGRIKNLQLALDHDCECNIDSAYEAAAQKGHLHVLQWLDKQRYKTEAYRRISIAGAKGGHLHVMKWAEEKGRKWETNYELNTIASNGHFELLKKLVGRITPSANTCAAAIAGKHKELYEYILAEFINETNQDTIEELCLASISAENFEMMEWCYDRGFLPKVDHVIFAANLNLITSIEWMIERNPELLRKALCDICRCIVRLGDMDRIERYTKDTKVFPNIRIILTWEAVATGNMEVIRWLEENGYAFENVCFKFVGKSVSPELVKWMHKKGCGDWTQAMCSASGTGNMEVLHFIKSVDEDAKGSITLAANSKRLDVLSWFTKLQNARAIFVPHMITDSVKRLTSLFILKFLRAQGCGWGEDLIGIAMNYNRHQVVIWAVENGCPLPNNDWYFSLANSPDPRARKWAEENQQYKPKVGRITKLQDKLQSKLRITKR